MYIFNMAYFSTFAHHSDYMFYYFLRPREMVIRIPSYRSPDVNN